MTTLQTFRFPAESAADRARQAIWPLLIGLACFAGCYWPQVVRRWDAWCDEAAVRAVLTEFFHALADGRKDAALQILGDAVDKHTIAEDDAAPEAEWRSSGPIEVRFSEIVIENNEAQAYLTIVQDACEILATVSLDRSPGGHWRIRRIDELTIESPAEISLTQPNLPTEPVED